MLKSKFAAALALAAFTALGTMQAKADDPLDVGKSGDVSAMSALLAQNGWYPLARGKRPIIGQIETGQMVVLGIGETYFFRKNGSDQIKRVNVTNDTARIVGGGSILYITEPMGPYQEASAERQIIPARPLPVADDEGNSKCQDHFWQMKFLIMSKAGAGPVIGYLDDKRHVLVDIFAGALKDKHWLITERTPGSDKTCEVSLTEGSEGFGFEPSGNYMTPPPAAVTAPPVAATPNGGARPLDRSRPAAVPPPAPMPSKI